MVTMLPDNVVTDLKNFMFSNGLGGGYNYHFTMVMKDPDTGVYSFHDRPKQPCIGGNLRKYGKSHPDDCTRPSDSCPSDLDNHWGNRRSNDGPKWRFPDGIPSGVGYHTGFDSKNTEYVKLCYSAKSPWVRGFGCADAVDLLYRGDSIVGVVIKTGDFDPTVLIHLQKHLQGNHISVFEKAVAKGFTEEEALVLTAYTAVEGIYYDEMKHVFDPSRPVFTPADSYQFDGRSSIKRMINQEPLDLTGGLWSDRYDYHRPHLALVFRDKEKDKTSFVKKVNNEAWENKEDLYVTALQIMRKEIGT